MFEALGHYRILDRIGSGAVCRARDTKLGRTVAIRVVSRDIADDPELRRQFLADAHAASALSHPNIAALYEIGEDHGALYAVFEFVPGEPLERVIAGRPLHPRRAVDLTAQIADAVAEAHGHSIVHRHISSETIIVTPKEKAKILDFGVAAWTRGGAGRATLAYLSPEQARGDDVGHRTDIFSTGIVLFEMLTGQVPWTANVDADLVREIGDRPAPAPSAIAATVPRELDRVVARALAKSPDERYESAAGLAAELRQFAEFLDARAERRDSDRAEAGRAGGAGSAGGVRGGELPVRWIVFGAALAVIAAAGWCALLR